MFEKIRPFQIALIGAFAFLALFGIFAFASFRGTGSNDKAGNVLIWGTLPNEAIEAGIAEIKVGNDQYGDVKYEEHDAATFDRDLANALAAGAGPDLIILTQEELLNEEDKLLLIPPASLSARAFSDTFLSLFQLYQTEEGSYGVPLVLDPMVLYYNQATLASAGVATAPTTWEAVSGLTKPIVQRTSDGAIARALVPFGEYGNVEDARGTLSLLLLQAGTAITTRSDRGVESVLAAPGGTFGQTAAQSALNFYTQFADPAKAVYTWNRSLPKARQLFVAGDLALYPGFASELPYLLAANPHLEFDIAPIPQPGTAPSRLTYGLGYALAIPKATPNPTGAMKTAFALSAETPMKAVADALSMVPARRSLVGKGTDDKYATVAYADALVAKGWLSPAPSATDAVFSAMIGNVTSGRMDASAALQAAADALDAALR